MLSPRWHRLTARGLVLVYALAVSFGGLLHDHGPHDCHAGHDRACDEDSYDGAACDDDEPCSAAGAESIASVTSGAAECDDSDCAVCSFLAQQPLPIQVVTISASHESVASFVAPTPLDAAAPLPRTLHSRAPPAVA